MNGLEGLIFESDSIGKLVVILFGFFLGYGVMLVEFVLNVLGDIVEKIIVGVFCKWLLM